jgi:hypothetical protein
MKKIYTLLVGLFIFTGINAQIFTENFNNQSSTGGNDGNWSGNIAAGNITGLTDWNLANCSAGNQCIKAGTGSQLGVVTTPQIDVTKGILKFRAGAWNASSEKTTLNISISEGTLNSNTVTLVKGMFQEYEIGFEGATNPTFTFSGYQASNSRFFLDDVEIYGYYDLTLIDNGVSSTETGSKFVLPSGTYNDGRWSFLGWTVENEIDNLQLDEIIFEGQTITLSGNVTLHALYYSELTFNPENISTGVNPTENTKTIIKTDRFNLKGQNDKNGILHKITYNDGSVSVIKILKK